MSGRAGQIYGKALFQIRHDGLFSRESIPHCFCGGVVRCDVTLYEETLPEEAVENAVDAIAHADMLIIGGTSLTVWPASSYVGYFRGNHLAVINRDQIGVRIRPDHDVVITGSIGEVFTEVKKRL